MLRGTHFHIDSSNVRKDRNGRLHVSGRLTRTGVFPYYVGGKKMLELRPESSVFDPHALETLKAAPVTIDHPRAFVSPKDEEVVGTVTKVEVDPPFVNGEMVIDNVEAIELIEAGKLTEVSLGYETDLERGDSEEYDLVQQNIRYNHAALGGPGWSRLGDTTLHLDGKTHYIMDTLMQDERTDSDAAEAVETPDAPEIDIEIEGEAPEAVEAVESAEEAPEAPVEEAPEETVAEEAPAEEEESKPDVDFVAMSSKVDLILELLQKKEDSKDIPRFDSDEFKQAVSEAVEKALEERAPKKREYSVLREKIVGQIEGTGKREKFSKLRAHVLGDE